MIEPATGVHLDMSDLFPRSSVLSRVAVLPLLVGGLLTTGPAVAGASTAGQDRGAIAPPRIDPPAGPIGFTAPDDPAEIGDVARVAFVADVARIRPGQTFHLAFTASMAKHWHTYWVNPGDTGVPTSFEVTAPAGFRVGEPLHPRPQVIINAEGTTYGYEEEAWIFIPVTAPRDLPTDGRELRFDIEASYLVCRDICLLGFAEGTVTLPTTTGPSDPASPATVPAEPADAATMLSMRPWLARLPKPLAELPGATAEVDLDRATLRLRVPASAVPAGAASPVILPAPGPGVGFGSARVARADDGGWDILVPLELSPGNTLGRPYLIRGLIGFGAAPTDPAWRFAMTFPVPADRG
jgi:DsbC/DsbD-like thiol-disulfide interchange protein